MAPDTSPQGLQWEARNVDLLAAAELKPPSRKDVLKVRSSHWDAQVILPSKSVPLQPDVRHRYVLNQLGLRNDPGELYHERSKLHRDSGREETHRELEQAHLSVFCTLTLNGYIDLVPEGGAKPNGFYDKVAHFNEDVQSLCAVASQDPRLLYAADLYLLLEREGRVGLYRYYLADDALNLLREVPRERVPTLLDAVPRARGREADPAPDARGRGGLIMAFVVGAVGRMFLVHDDGAYRLSVLRAGQLASAVHLWARMEGLDARVYDSFYDDELNLFLGCEGVTKSLMAIVTF